LQVPLYVAEVSNAFPKASIFLKVVSLLILAAAEILSTILLTILTCISAGIRGKANTYTLYKRFSKYGAQTAELKTESIIDF
jgi:hypothetical protein